MKPEPTPPGGEPASLARTPEPPYLAVIFTSIRTADDDGYGDTAARMLELASGQPGFLGVESARTPDGLGITVSYWTNESSIAAWKAHTEHRAAQEGGRKSWYAAYAVRVARVERAHTWPVADRSG